MDKDKARKQIKALLQQAIRPGTTQVEVRAILKEIQRLKALSGIRLKPRNDSKRHLKSMKVAVVVRQ